MLRVQREYLAILELMKEHPELLSNIVIYHYDCQIRTIANKADGKWTHIKGLVAVNMHFELTAEWQVECHIIKKYGAVEFHEKNNSINPISVQ